VVGVEHIGTGTAPRHATSTCGRRLVAAASARIDDVSRGVQPNRRTIAAQQ
jgi:hypothetical protein